MLDLSYPFRRCVTKLCSRRKMNNADAARAKRNFSKWYRKFDGEFFTIYSRLYCVILFSFRICIHSAQQVERENLAAVAEVDASLEGAKSSSSIFKPKASPKPRLFSALKKDGRSRSNSTVLSIRRFSTDSILGNRLDSIGRRLSRDLNNSPPDLGHRFDTFGKGDAVNKYDTISCAKLGASSMSKSNEILSNRYDTFSGKYSDKSDIAVKLKKPGKRPKIRFESYHRDKFDDQSEYSDEREYELPPVKESLEPPMCQEDRSTAILRHKMHTELLSKYPPVPNSNIHGNNHETTMASTRPPLPKKRVKYQDQHQMSLDNLDVRNGSSNAMKTSPLTPKYSSADSKSSPRSQISVERLSREDLLRLSHSSQSEIHEYLKNSIPQRPAEPPWENTSSWTKQKIILCARKTVALVDLMGWLQYLDWISIKMFIAWLGNQAIGDRIIPQKRNFCIF